jgi:O-antigen/teichoic acid export membrane protein
MPENIKKGTILNFFAYTLSGIFLFFFNIIAARGLSPDKFGIISVLWVSIMIVARLLTTGIKDGTTKFISQYEAIDNKHRISHVFLVNLKLTIFISIFFLAISLILYRILISHLFSGELILYIFFLLSCVLYFFLLFLRGALQGLRELKHSAISIIVEYSAMLIFLIIFFQFAKDVKLVGLSILLAPILSILYILTTIPKHKVRFSTKPAETPDLQTILYFVIPTSFINFSSGFMSQLGPLFIKILGNFSLAGLFNASLVLFKAARTTLTSLFISIFPHLSRQETLQNFSKLNKIIKNGTIFVLVVFAVLIVVSLTIGQSIIGFIYGTEYVIAKIHLFMMSLFTGFFLLSELFNRVLLSKTMIKELSCSWLIALVCFIVLLFIPLETLLKVECALLGAGFIAFISMLIFLIKSNKIEKN